MREFSVQKPVRRAFGFPDPPRWMSRLVHRSLRAHAWAERILPKRKVSRLTKGPIIRSYPGYPAGYTVSGLGTGKPPPDIDPATIANGVVTIILSLLMSVVRLGGKNALIAYGGDVAAVFEAALDPVPPSS